MHQTRVLGTLDSQTAARFARGLCMALGTGMKKYPDGWNLTLRALIERRTGATAEEVAWAKAYERDQLPSDTRFPKGGEIFEAIQEAKATYSVYHAMPYTGGGECLLRVGQRIRVEIADREPLVVGAHPLDTPNIWEELIPAERRNHPKVTGFSLSITTAELNRSFRLITNA